MRSRRCFRRGRATAHPALRRHFLPVFAHQWYSYSYLGIAEMTRPSSLIVASLSCLCFNTHVTAFTAFSSSRSVLRQGAVSRPAAATSALWSGTQEDEDDEEATDILSIDGSDADSQYRPPKHTSSFLEHLESVRSSWPDSGSSKEGVDCTGEPSVDPSRTIQAAETDDSNWM